MRDEKLFALLQAAATMWGGIEAALRQEEGKPLCARDCVDRATALLAEIESRDRGTKAPEAEPERPAVPAGLALVSEVRLNLWSRVLRVASYFSANHSSVCPYYRSGEPKAKCDCGVAYATEDCAAALDEARREQGEKP